MAKTYESIYTYPDGHKIVVARGSKKHAEEIAVRSHLVPFEIREFQTPENITEMYREWRKENGNKKPNRVIVKMHWEDEDINETRVDTIGLVDKRWWDNCDDIAILWYSSGLKGLLELLQPDNGSDFILDEVLEFYKV